LTPYAHTTSRSLPEVRKPMRLFGIESNPEQLDAVIFTFACDCGHAATRLSQPDRKGEGQTA
jgi:hypothetical protein